MESLVRRFPSSQIDVLVRKGNESLFANHPFVNEVQIWDKQAGKYSQLWKCLKHIRSERYDLLINFQRFASSGFLTAFSKAKIKQGYAKNPFSVFFTHAFKHEIGTKGARSYPHEIDRNHALIAAWCGERNEEPKLYPPVLPTDVAIQQPYIVIAPSSVWFTKQYPIEKWVELLDALAETRATVYLIGAPSDKELCDHLLRETKHQNVENRCGQLSLLESAKLMEGALMSFVNDSAPLHLASSVNAPVTAIFCSTIPEFGFGPTGSNGNLVQTSDDLACRPCGLHGKKACPLGHFNCAKSIDVADLLAKVETIE